MQEKKLLNTLFDLSFSEFITIRVIKILFIIGIVVAAFMALAVIVAGFDANSLVGVLCLFVSPIVFLIYVLFARIWCEMIIVVFRIAENTSRMADQSKLNGSSSRSIDV